WKAALALSDRRGYSEITHFVQRGWEKVRRHRLRFDAVYIRGTVKKPRKKLLPPPRRRGAPSDSRGVESGPLFPPSARNIRVARAAAWRTPPRPPAGLAYRDRSVRSARTPAFSTRWRHKAASSVHVPALRSILRARFRSLHRSKR